MAEGFRNIVLRADDLPERAVGPDIGAARRLDLLWEQRLPPPPRRSDFDAARDWVTIAFANGLAPVEGSFGVLPEVAGRPAVVSELLPVEVLDSPIDDGGGTVVRFAQRYRGRRVYGARTTVTLDADQHLVELDFDLGEPQELEDAPEPEDLGSSLAQAFGVVRQDEHVSSSWFGFDPSQLMLPTNPLATTDPPVELVYYRVTRRERFLLCWLFRRVPTRSTSVDDKGRAGPSRTSRFFVHAVDGEVVRVLPEHRDMIPILCSGEDEQRDIRSFDGSEVAGGGCAMQDVYRRVQTCDLAYAPQGPLVSPVTNATPDWSTTNRAAVSAQANGVVVQSFVDRVFARKGLDGKSSYIQVGVNCSPDPTTKEWRNAEWTPGGIYFGQAQDQSGAWVSWAKDLHLVAHELMHGITKTTANLDYQDESGALDESLCDIFGLIVENLAAGRAATSSWSWELGPGLGNAGGPLRDLGAPARGTPAQPATLANWTPDPNDHGGVHLNSGIHNVAGHGLLTATLSNGNPAFEPEEVAKLYYWILLKAPNSTDFSDMRQRLVDAVTTRYRSDPFLQERIDAVKDAYTAAGIP